MAAPRKKTRDMTQGTIWKHLLAFALPLMIGNLFQQLYNTVDSIVVGHYVGDNALAAVGSSSPILNLLLALFLDLGGKLFNSYSVGFGCAMFLQMQEPQTNYHLLDKYPKPCRCLLPKRYY